MKQYSKKLFSLVALCSAIPAMLDAMSSSSNNNNAFGGRVVPFLQWRSQGRDMARKLYGTTSWAVYQPDMDDFYGTFNVTVQYDQSFRGKQIAEALFGAAVTTTPASTTTTTNNCNNDCDSESITISGLASATRGTFDLMAENFLLPRDFKSTITFKPKVQDVVVDLNLFVGLDRWVNGLYFRLYGPVTWNRATLKPEENIINPGTAAGAYSQGFLDPNGAVPITSMFKGALSYFGGCQFPVAPYTVSTDSKAVTVQPLMFAKFSECNLTTPATTNNCNDDCGNSFRRHKTGFAELRGEFGYNYIADKYRLLLNIQAAAPTGSKVKAKYLFPAQVGNGHHWELGVGVGGAWRMWCNEEDDRSFNFIVEADITHLFKAKQERTFDLKCKPLSRYMLAEQLLPQTDVGEQLVPNTPIFNVVGSGIYAPVANFSTRDVNVSIGVQGDLVAMFNFTCRGFSWDLGYNFWAMSSSKIKLSDNCNDNDNCDSIINPFPTNFALKGDASVAGYTTTAVFGLGATETGTATTLGATIFNGVGGSTGGVAGLVLNNANVDNAAQAAFANPTPPPATLPLFVFGTAGTATPVPINTSNPPVFITIDDLDIDGARQRGLSNKVFTHFSYAWRDCSEKWVPYVGLGASAEFGSHSHDDECSPTTPTANCNTCPSSLSFALSKWAVEVKGGVSFH